ncbi:hypothetical protein [Aliiruegeria lutimaris]|uniref:hypothetical protein n=1 Tax=Aliiruegeria lutimaris TaxID=571298 RepID=UPI0011134E0C|nr:hypothetical protein [Aliiruegeria lutimaris]
MKDKRFAVRGANGHWRGPVIGLVQAPGSQEPAGGWGWVTGEPLVYQNWSSGRPDHRGNGQNFGAFFGTGRDIASVMHWDDVHLIGKSFIVEFD